MPASHLLTLRPTDMDRLRTAHRDRTCRSARSRPLPLPGGVTVCSATTCKTCGKTTWTGCGQHISQVRRGVPAHQWCNGRHTPEEIAAAKAERGNFFTRLLGR